MPTNKPFDELALERHAYNMRRMICETIINNGEGHGGPALSCTDILAVLYMNVMNIDMDDPTGPDCDKFLLSAGHKCLALYAALAEKGIIDKKVLSTYNQLGTPVPGHPDMTKLRGVQFSTGSLGHGLPIGCGLAKAAKMQGKDYMTYVLMGDGEHGEGSVWEAAAYAVHNKLDNLVAIIDENGLQINGTTAEVLRPAPFEDRYGGFGWAVRSIDGHNLKEIYDALNAAPFEKGKPSLIVAKTHKGRGISFMENNINYHHWHPGEEEAKKALAELDAMDAALKAKEAAK